MIEGSSLVRPFLQTGENLESLSCIFGLLYVHSFRFKVVQRLGVSVAAPPRHFPRSITKISSFCASLRPCCVFSFRRPRCFLISFKSPFLSSERGFKTKYSGQEGREAACSNVCHACLLKTFFLEMG